MLPDRVSNPGHLTYESGALPIALRGPASKNRTTIQTESSFSKINEDLDTDKLRKSKHLRNLVSKEMKDCGLIDSEDSCAVDVSEIENIDSFLHAEADSEACSKSMYKT